jgi:hypothetical protein
MFKDMGWKKPRIGGDANYSQVVKEGFVVTEGTTHLCFPGSPFAECMNYPTFHVLRVHRNHPIEISDCGGIFSIRPVGDTRLIGDIVRDKNPRVYDSVAFFLTPYDIRLNEQYPGVVLAKFPKGFRKTGAEESGPASLVFMNQRGMGVDDRDINILSIVPPSQIPYHFARWSMEDRRLWLYEKSKDKFDVIGRFDLEGNLGDLSLRVVRELEKRFETRISANRRRELEEMR